MSSLLFCVRWFCSFWLVSCRGSIIHMIRSVIHLTLWPRARQRFTYSLFLPWCVRLLVKLRICSYMACQGGKEESEPGLNSASELSQEAGAAQSVSEKKKGRKRYKKKASKVEDEVNIDDHSGFLRALLNRFLKTNRNELFAMDFWRQFLHLQKYKPCSVALLWFTSVSPHLLILGLLGSRKCWQYLHRNYACTLTMSVPHWIACSHSCTVCIRTQF